VFGKYIDKHKSNFQILLTLWVQKLAFQ